MNQCLRCSKPCERASVFCDGCRLLLRSQLGEPSHTRSQATIEVPSPVGMSSEGTERDIWVSHDPLERITGPQPVVSSSPPHNAPQTPPPIGLETYGNVAEHAIRRLEEAAQRIAQVEQGNRHMPRASRLAPMHDISADIQRESTPLLQVAKAPESQHSEDLGRQIPDLWPWLQDMEHEESENDIWSNRTDPLLARHLPNSADIAQIEEEDIRRAIAEGLIMQPVRSRRVRPSHPMRLAFAVLAILAIMALVVDGVLITFAFIHPHRLAPVVNGSPTLTLSSNTAAVGQSIVLHIRHFSASTRVLLTHDIGEAVQLTSESALVRVGTSGSADMTMLVDTSWGPGFHTIEAEDVLTRYTASATLQIVGSGPTPPSHLLVGAASLDMGADFQGGNTIQHITLNNSGGGSISWAASSNEPWLLISPSAGIFSESQTIAVAVERANLKPKDYSGTITFSSNVGSAEQVQVHMTVRPLPANVGAVLQVTPAVLAFTTVDGGSNPNGQMLMVNNPGSQPLSWSIASNTPLLLAGQSLLFDELGSNTNWLSTDQNSGTIAPHGTSYIQVSVNSQTLLPGVYTDVLVFSGPQGVYNSPQNVSVSLTVQPQCGLTLSTGSISFTAVSGQSNPSNRSLSVSTNSSCAGVINWKAVSAASWLTVTPAGGQLKPAVSAVTSVGVNVTGLKPGTYVSNLSFLAGQNTAALMVQLIVQTPPPPSAPIMGAAPLGLNFSTTEGLASPAGQVVTITNTGGSSLQWRTSVNTLASSWLGAGPTGGTIAPGGTAQLTVVVNTAGLSPNTYVGQVILSATDANGMTAWGSPQTITINLVVLPPCTLAQPSLRSLAFSTTQGSSNPSSQAVMITASGNCSWPLSWHASPTSPAPAWLNLTPASGSLSANGQSASISVAANIAQMTPGTYTTQIAIKAVDGSNTAAQGSPQFVSVTLTVLQPCLLKLSTASLAFAAAQGQSPAPSTQGFTLSESGSCVLPVSWSATGDGNSHGWLSLSSTSGTDNGSGDTVNVHVNSASMGPGTYTGTITVSASGSGGASVQGSPVTVTVTLTITGFTVSGSVVACADTACSSSKPLPGTTLTLMNSAGNVVSTITATKVGNYAFNNLALGNYTIGIVGSKGSSSYTGNVALTVSGNQSNFVLNAYPKS